MLQYTPGSTFAHRVDPRGKLLVQMSFAFASFCRTTPRGLIILTVVAGIILASGRCRPESMLRGYLPAMPFLILAPLVAGITGWPPTVEFEAVYIAGLASYRIVLILLVSGVYVVTTPIRDSRAAVQWLLPGRVGSAAGIAIEMVFRFFPLLRADVTRLRAATAARLGTSRPVREQMQHLGGKTLRYGLLRADRLSEALQARCLAWNPTLRTLQLSRHDIPSIILSVLLVYFGLQGSA